MAARAGRGVPGQRDLHGHGAPGAAADRDPAGGGRRSCPRCPTCCAPSAPPETLPREGSLPPRARHGASEIPAPAGAPRTEGEPRALRHFLVDTD
ncbi:hypothetical protein QJS66_06280 [Kocuria rhizophila]|nr:hypothetical protein QJS66_06280 [Kocuria rhizophila]